ncbi:hypothetical protein AB1286_29995 [Trinickia sp. NRRL B-1857]|uniref:hypothetical protein n=1 Tax=Trinickia sp. NRRL B-1857 TaxID=3162879 RepID=UPI003D2E6C21
MSTIESNLAVIEIGALKISFSMNDPRIASLSEQIAETSNTVLGLSVPEVGAYWDGQGGIYAGIMPARDGKRPYHLIAAIEDGVDLQWGAGGNEAKSLHDGLENTRALVEREHDHPAAEWASKYTKDGCSDFYLPAQRELNLCYATCAEQFEKDWYWSSTQYSALNAWYQHFDDGTQDYADKDLTGRARAVRRLFI